MGSRIISLKSWIRPGKPVPTYLKQGRQFLFTMNKEQAAKKQKEKAKEMLGISDDRAEEIFEEQADRKQQKKQELEDK